MAEQDEVHDGSGSADHVQQEQEVAKPAGGLAAGRRFGRRRGGSRFLAEREQGLTSGMGRAGLTLPIGSDFGSDRAPERAPDSAGVKRQVPATRNRRAPGGEHRYGAAGRLTVPPPFPTSPPVTRVANRRFATIVFARSAVRHPRRIAGTWSAGLRPASRGSAKPAPTTLRPANLTAANGVSPICVESRGHGAPVSDRHRAGARNPHQQRRPLPISLLRTAYRRSAQNRGDMERWPVLPVGASDRHRAGARNPHQQRCALPISLLRTAYRRSAQNRGDMERRPVLPVGASDRHRAGARNPHQRRRPPPISLLRIAGVSPPDLLRTANRGDMERRPVLPVGASDRHRAGARNPHQRRRPPPIVSAAPPLL